jgi:electron transport complex protein RnfC
MRKLSGVKVPHNKHTAHMKHTELPIPATVTIPMSMHIGAPAKVIVSRGDEVKVGQVIGEASGFVSAPVHSSVSGKVKAITEAPLSSGGKTPAVVIESDGLQTPYEGLAPREINSLEDFLAAVRDSGAVGLGGAGFPTAVKFTVKDAGAVETIIINGAECEPYITSDTRTMVDSPELIIEGAALLRRFFPNAKVKFGIEDNKPEAIKVLTQLCQGADGVSVHALPAMYPQGGEKVIIYNMTGKIVPEGGLPINVGVIVLNCTTLECIMKFIKTGLPLVSKCVTVDGSAISKPQNVLAPIGAPISELLSFCEAGDDIGKILMGGPMMGIAVCDINSPVLKNNNAVLAFKEKDSKLPEPSACIRCGRCVRACPMKLMPLELETAYNLKNAERLEQLKVNLCMECGCCAFSCPASRPLVQNMKLSKIMLRAYQEAKKIKKEAESK